MRLREVLALDWERVDMAALVFRVDDTKSGAPLELPVTHQLAAIIERRREENGPSPEGPCGWVFPSTPPGALGHIADLPKYYPRIGEAAGTRFWYRGLRNFFITVAERDLLLPHALTRWLVNHAPGSDITEGYAADWTVAQLREPAQRIADRIETLVESRSQEAVGACATITATASTRRSQDTGAMKRLMPSACARRVSGMQHSRNRRGTPARTSAPSGPPPERRPLRHRRSAPAFRPCLPQVRG